MTTHVRKLENGPCVECGAQPSEIQHHPDCTPIARALFKRGRTTKAFEVLDFFGLVDTKGKPSNMLGMRILSIGEETEAIDAAHKTRSDQSKRAGDAKDAAKNDGNAFEAEKNLEALLRICREVNEKGEPTQLPAFPGTRWMRENLSADQLGTLLNLYDELKRKHGPIKLDIDDETVEIIAKVLHEHAGDDIPEAFLAPYQRWWLTHFAVLVSTKLGEARRSLDLLLEEREAWEVERANLQAELAARRGDAEPAEADHGPET